MSKILHEMLQEMVAKGASDLHVSAGQPPMIRVDGSLVPLRNTVFTAEESQNICYEILAQEQVMKFEQALELDFGVTLRNGSRFRGNLFWQQQSVAGVFRTIPTTIPTFQDLGLPPAVQNLSTKTSGLVLVTGATGSGKSTTLAALINAINESQAKHIITIEDPIEFIYSPKKSLVHQREIGKDTTNFANALKYVLREDPDVVLIGEMRDMETLRAAITMAETGQLVLATLQTGSAVQSVDRIIDVFPAHQQAQVKVQLSIVLQGILSQQLLPKSDKGRCLALELMIPTVGIRNLLREGKTDQIYSHIQSGKEGEGLQTMNQSLAGLVKKKLISKETAFSRSQNPEELKKLI